MTFETLNHITREHLSRLHPMTKKEFMAWANNMLQVIIGHADNIASGQGNDPVGAATSIASTGRNWHAELEVVFAQTPGLAPDALKAIREADQELPPKRNPDAHLGSDKE